MSQKYIGVVLPVRRGQTGMFDQSITLLQQVRSNFKNLILTKKGERVGQSDLGCDIWKILFEPLTDETLENARLSVTAAVDRWLPFIELIDFEIRKTADDKVIDIKCKYLFRSNPNVVDQVSVSSQELGLPTQGFQQEPTTQSDIDELGRKIEQARRIRRIQEAAV